MKDFEPTPPQHLEPLAKDVLEGLRGMEGARFIVLGGGVALQHYVEFRRTVDIDAWWAGEVRTETRDLLTRVMEDVGRARGLQLVKRSWGETESYELLKGQEKVFSFQIALRSVQLEAAKHSAWQPVQVESFRDNLGSKMSALVGRGAPRDFLDVREVCRRGLAREDECWQVWQDKNPDRNVREARVNVLRHVELLESRRPLAALSENEREAAQTLRDWVRQSLCRERIRDHEIGR